MLYQLAAWISLFGFLIITPRFIHGFWPDYIDNCIISYKCTIAKVFYVTSMFLTHLLLYIVLNAYYYGIYRQKNPFFEQYKVEKVSVGNIQNPQPWEQNAQQWALQKQKTIRTMILNILLRLGVSLVTAYFEMNFRIDKQFPSEFEIFIQLGIFAILQDFIFYWSHRILHHPLLYSRIHKQHHEYNITVSIAAEYAHPVEFIFANVFPVLAGPLLLGSRCHLITVLLWSALSVHKPLSDHSGYSFPWEVYQYIPYSVDCVYHSAHHSLNTGNYSSTLLLWDIIGSTKIKIDKKRI